jgi:hypothetical protein
MGKLIFKLVLLFGVCFCGLNTSAYDGLKLTKKKNPDLKVESKKPLFANKTDEDDTLVFEKAKDDTLIFADDEMHHQNFKRNDKKINEEILPSNIKHTNVSLNSNLYPNPSNGIAWIEVAYSAENSTEIIISTLDGKMVSTDNFSGNKYKIEGLASGAYIITLKNGKELIRKRFFVN